MNTPLAAPSRPTTEISPPGGITRLPGSPMLATKTEPVRSWEKSTWYWPVVILADDTAWNPRASDPFELTTAKNVWAVGGIPALVAGTKSGMAPAVGGGCCLVDAAWLDSVSSRTDISPPLWLVRSFGPAVALTQAEQPHCREIQRRRLRPPHITGATPGKPRGS